MTKECSILRISGWFCSKFISESFFAYVSSVDADFVYRVLILLGQHTQEIILVVLNDCLTLDKKNQGWLCEKFRITSRASLLLCQLWGYLRLFRLQLIRTTVVLTYVEFECRVEIVVLNDIYLSEVWVHVAVWVHHSDQRCLAALFPSEKTTWTHKSFFSIPIITLFQI